MISELLKQEITSRLPYLKPGNKGWLVCNCPLCVAMGTTADKRKRFGVMFESDGTIGVHCFNCTFVTLAAQEINSIAIATKNSVFFIGYYFFIIIW